MKTKRVHIRVGDVFEIPLSNGKKGYCQYILRDRVYGTLIRVFNIVTNERIEIDQLKNTDLLFPFVYTSVHAGAKIGWKIIGHLPVEEFTYPMFVDPDINGSIENIHNWSLWDGNKYTRLGHPLPNKYKHLELLVVFSPYDIAKRIETGRNTLQEWYEK